MERIHLFISGKVQGVFFRARTKEKADELHLAGWVRNLNDGRVEAVFEGTSDSIEQIIAWCKDGPPFSSVSHVDEIKESFEGSFSSFTILY